MNRQALTRYAALTLVRDGDGYVLGSRHSADFVAVPRIGGEVVQWLQAGYTVEECADRAAQVVGEPVDVAGFIYGLTTAGLLPPHDTTSAEQATRDAGGQPDVARWARRTGRILFGGPGLAVQIALAAAGLVAMVSVPQLRPAYTDIIVSDIPLLSLIMVAVVATASGLGHEYAHVAAAAARGVPARVSISRRLVWIVYQTNLTRLWGVPRRTRVVPLLAGLLSDAATVGVLVVAEATVLPGTLIPFARMVIFLKSAGIVFQLQVFMRTDLYALFVVATGSRNLWGTKGAAARRAIRRATSDDLALLATVDRREIRWATFYLFLYLPGVVWTAWYVVTFAVPALRRLLAMSVEAIIRHGLLSPVGAAGAVAAAVTVASTAFVLRGIVGTAVQLGAQLRRPRP
jgi:hypothetical protein